MSFLLWLISFPVSGVGDKDWHCLFFFHGLTFKTITAQLGKYTGMQVSFRFKAPIVKEKPRESTEKLIAIEKSSLHHIQILFTSFDKNKTPMVNYLSLLGCLWTFCYKWIMALVDSLFWANASVLGLDKSCIKNWRSVKSQYKCSDYVCVLNLIDLSCTSCQFCRSLFQVRKLVTPLSTRVRKKVFTEPCKNVLMAGLTQQRFRPSLHATEVQDWLLQLCREVNGLVQVKNMPVSVMRVQLRAFFFF